MKQIQIPTGMRDTILDDAVRKDHLKKRIDTVYESYGYRKIETPLIEFYSTYQYAFSSIREGEMYKFIDEDGSILALRTDMTLPIARVCAAKYANINPPYRFRYASNVYKVRQHFAGKRNEVTDCGIELIGADSTADLEVLACALDVMKVIEADDYTFEIGNSNFFKKACESAQLMESDAKTLADLVDRKSMVELREYLDGTGLNKTIKDFFMSLPLLSGKNALVEAKKVSFNDSLQEVILGMEELEKELQLLGYNGHVQFDFGKVPHLDYYTGIIFEGYVSGVGTSVLSGGRYDNLLAKFGRDLPACGFGVKLDYLLDILHEPIEKPLRVYYPKEKRVEALRKAAELRTTGRSVELIYQDGLKAVEVVK